MSMVGNCMIGHRKSFSWWSEGLTICRSPSKMAASHRKIMVSAEVHWLVNLGAVSGQKYEHILILLPKISRRYKRIFFCTEFSVAYRFFFLLYMLSDRQLNVQIFISVMHLPGRIFSAMLIKTKVNLYCLDPAVEFLEQEVPVNLVPRCAVVKAVILWTSSLSTGRNSRQICYIWLGSS